MTHPSPYAPTLVNHLRTARVMLANYAAHDESQGQTEDAQYTRRVIENIDRVLEQSRKEPKK